MKIVLLYGGIRNLGGAERLLLEEAMYFSKKGVECIIATFDFDKTALYDYPSKVNILKINGKNILTRVFYLTAALHNIKPDLIIAHAQFNQIYAYLSTRLVKIPYIYHLHGTSFWFPEDNIKYSFLHKNVFDEIRNSLYGHTQFTEKNRKFSLVGRISLEIRSVLDYLATRRSLMIFTLTNQVKKEIKLLYKRDAIVARAGVAPSLINFVPNTQVTQCIKDRYNLSNKKVVLTINRLDRRKRIDILIQAFADLSRKDNELHLLIVGTGDDEIRLKKMVEELDLKEKVSFTGYIEEDELPYYYKICDVFAYPGWCAWGLSAIEALAMNKKIVVSSDAMVVESINQSGNVFISEPKSEEFCQALQKACGAENKISANQVRQDLTWEIYFGGIYYHISQYLNVEKD